MKKQKDSSVKCMDAFRINLMEEPNLLFKKTLQKQSSIFPIIIL